MSDIDAPYHVEPAEHYGHPSDLWIVVGPSGDAGGRTHVWRSDAQEEANALNHAYELGYKAGREEG